MSDYQANIITKSPVTPAGPSPTGSAPGIWRLDEVAYWVKQGVWPDVTADQYWPYVAYLMSTTATNAQQNNTFLDSSTNNFTITRNGNTTQGSVNPYGADWSNYFDGSGDYLTVASNAAFGFGTGDFTIEGWVFATGSTASGNVIADFRTGTGTAIKPCIYFDSAYTLYYLVNGSNVINGGTIPTNSWVHVALARSGTSTKMFVNGVQVGSTYSDSNNYGASASCFIGADNDGAANAFLVGYASNVRVVKGTAVYTSAFTPPTAPLTAITNTSLLTCQSNRFRDNSTNAFTITVNGNTAVTSFSPFSPSSPGYTAAANGGSGYFDGSGDYLTAPDNAALQLGSSNFTIEFWVNFSVVPGAGQGATLVSKFDTSNTGYEVILYNNTMYFQAQTANIGMTYAFTPTAGAWYHIAWTRSGSNSYGFINGALVASTAAASGSITNLAQALQIGRRGDNTFYLNGYMSNVRIVKGTAVYTAAFTPPTAPLTAITNTSLLLNFTNAGIFDATTRGSANKRNAVSALPETRP